MQLVVNKQGNGYNVVEGKNVLAKDLTKIDALNFVVAQNNPVEGAPEPDDAGTTETGTDETQHDPEATTEPEVTTEPESTIE
jgi:hypothetical protein